MVKLVIFDLDGTLLDTLRQIHSLLNEALEQYGLPPVSLEEVRECIGGGANVLVDRLVKDEDKREKVFSSFSELYAESDNSLTSMFPNEDEVLTFLERKHVKMAIITNKPQDATCNVVSCCLPAYHFDIVIGQSDIYPLKPNPESTLAVINHYGIEKSKCLFVGDGETDVLTAKAAGIKCACALWGNRTKEQLQAVGGKKFISNFTELIDIVKKM